MLMLTIRPGESVIVGDSLITVAKVNFNKNSVLIGFDFPKDIIILREKIYRNQTKDDIQMEGNVNAIYKKLNDVQEMIRRRWQ